MKHIKLLCTFAVLALLTMPGVLTHAAASGTAFGYQGQLTASGVSANGGFDFTFALFNDPVAGAQAGSTVTNLNVGVSNGLFTTTVDFGSGVFDGTAYWLAIGVRSNGSGTAVSPLSARQPLTPSPYALYAAAAPLADNSVTGRQNRRRHRTGLGRCQRRADALEQRQRR